MKFTVDTNVLITFFWRTSVARTILVKGSLDLSAPEYAKTELNQHREEIRKKAKLTEAEFTATLKELDAYVQFVPLATYKSSIPTAKRGLPDPDDIDFLALAAYLKTPLWSNDARLKRQEQVRVLTTTELLDHPITADLLYPNE